MNDFTTFEELMIGLGYCLFMLVLGIVFLKFPPKKINYLYGYRTNRSMKTQEVWDAANIFSAKALIKISLWSLVFPVFSYLFFPKYTILITVIGNTILLLATLPMTENFIKKNFDEDGKALNN